MPQGDKDKYTDKQKRKAEHIEEGYEDRGVSHKEAERRAWATVNRSRAEATSPARGAGRRTATKARARAVTRVDQVRVRPSARRLPKKAGRHDAGAAMGDA